MNDNKNKMNMFNKPSFVSNKLKNPILKSILYDTKKPKNASFIWKYAAVNEVKDIRNDCSVI